MELKISKLATPYELTLHIDKETLNQALDDYWETAKDHIEVKGFRKGKVSQKVAEGTMFDELYKDVLPTLLAKELYKQELKIIHNFDIRMKGTFARDSALTILNRVYLFPKIELPTEFKC